MTHLHINITLEYFLVYVLIYLCLFIGVWCRLWSQGILCQNCRWEDSQTVTYFYTFNMYIFLAMETHLTTEVVSYCALFNRNSVRLVIRKVQYAPEKPGPQPMVETTRSFLMSDRSLHLEASLDKEVRTCIHLQTDFLHCTLFLMYSFVKVFLQSC